MAKSRGFLIGIVAVAILLIGWFASAYNGFVTSKAAVDASWAQVETQYQRRFDLVPNLVNTVKGSAAFEQQTLTAVTEARTKFLGAGTRNDQVMAANQFDSALSRLLVTVEAYPSLKSTQAFQDLMTQLEGTENRIATARFDYNKAVQSYNVQVQRFPGVLFANLFGFAPYEMFQSADGAENAPAVQF